MYNHTPQNPDRKPLSPLPCNDSGRSGTSTTAETLAECPANAPQKTRAEKLTAVDEVLSRFDRKAQWVSKELHAALAKGRSVWGTFEVKKRKERIEFERILAYLLARDPVIRRAIVSDSVEWHGSNGQLLTIWFRYEGGANRG
jgi:hypothetical protein